MTDILDDIRQRARTLNVGEPRFSYGEEKEIRAALRAVAEDVARKCEKVARTRGLVGVRKAQDERDAPRPQAYVDGVSDAAGDIADRIRALFPTAFRD